MLFRSPTVPCSIKNNYVKTALCDLGAGVSVMPFSLYKRLDLEKLIPTDISLHMADKSTLVPVGICEDVPVQVAHSCMILTDFVVLEMPEGGKEISWEWMTRQICQKIIISFMKFRPSR